jgi:hypothetical protein
MAVLLGELLKIYNVWISANTAFSYKKINVLSFIEDLWYRFLICGTHTLEIYV